jgi:hypothetical protein
MTQPIVAMAPDGTMAMVPGLFTDYRILRFDATGKPLAPITRNIARLQRSPEEIADIEARTRTLAGGERRGAETRVAGGAASTGTTATDWKTIKPHFAGDALRYDDRGRLWVSTMRGKAGTTTFDLFAPSGSYLGELSVPTKITAYAIRGSTLAAATETADGVPQVRLWTIR